MEYALKIALGLATMVFGAAMAGWVAWRFLKKSENPGSLVLKWIITVAAFLFLIIFVTGLGFVGPPVAAVVGIILGIIWAPSIAAVVAKPITNLFTGGDEEVEERPFYSIPKAKIMRGKYDEAIAEVKKQLQRFPQDYEGWMLLAEIYGDYLKDNDMAQTCVTEIVRQEGHAQRNIAFALNRSADWHLDLATDRDSARASLERVVELFPESEFAHNAAQRIAHLTSNQMLVEEKERPRIVLKRHDARIGLEGEVANPAPRIEEPADKAARLVDHLNEYPLDVEAREELATIYADHYQRIDLAEDQIEQLIQAAGASQKSIAHCLNLLADLHLRTTGDRTAVEKTLRRIAELFPNSAVAANAEKRRAFIDIELNRSKKSQAIKLGSYENNIGLKGQLPRREES